MQSLTHIIQQKLPQLIQIYSLLIAQLLITFLVLFNCIKNSALIKKLHQNSFALLIGSLILFIGLIVILAIPQIPIWIKIVVAIVLSIMEGYILCMFAGRIKVRGVNVMNLIKQSIVISVNLFVALSIVGYILAYFNINITSWGLYLLAALIVLILVQIVGLFIPYESGFHKILIIVGLLLFSVYVVYDTNIILMNEIENVFLSALSFYLDFINLFIRILSLNSRK
jgi:FtsH-binding integral membrane protein